MLNSTIATAIQRMAREFAGHGFIVVVPEIFHEHLEAGAVLPADPKGTEQGTQYKKTTKMSTYANDLDELIKHLNNYPRCSGRLGSLGFCVGGHIALRFVRKNTRSIEPTTVVKARVVHGCSELMS